VATLQNYYGGLWTFVGTDYEPFVVGFYMYFVRVFCYVDIKSDGPKVKLRSKWLIRFDGKRDNPGMPFPDVWSAGRLSSIEPMMVHVSGLSEQRPVSAGLVIIPLVFPVSSLIIRPQSQHFKFVLCSI
jgi:hypothetical protein